MLFTWYLCPQIKSLISKHLILKTVPFWAHCIGSLLNCNFKTKSELPLCFFGMILSYYLRLLFTEKYILYEMFFSIFLLLLPLYLSANFRARFCFMLTAIVNAKRVSCLNSIGLHTLTNFYSTSNNFMFVVCLCYLNSNIFIRFQILLCSLVTFYINSIMFMLFVKFLL